MIKAIVFDFFDVLRTDPYKAWLNSLNLAREGAYSDASHDLDMGHITDDQFFERLSKLQGRLVTREDFEKYAELNHAVVKIADQLHKRFKTALLSNAPSSYLRGLLNDHDLEKHFDEIIISSEVGMVKPNADIFTLALRKLNVNADEAIFIDDNEHHTNGAESLGIKSIQFTSADQLKQKLEELKILSH